MLLLIAYGLLHLPAVQTKLAQKAAGLLSERLHTKVSIESVDFAFFNKLEFKGLLIEDLKKDTLLYAGSARVNVNDWFFAKDKIVVKYLGLTDVFVHLDRSEETWNYQFLIDYFSSPASSKKKNKIELDCKDLQLINIRFERIDKWVGEDMIASIKKLDAVFKNFDINNQNISIEKIDCIQPYFLQTDYSGKRPLNYKPKIVKKTADKEAKPLVITLHQINIIEGSYQNERESNRLPYVNQFDENHIYFSDINGSIKDLIAKDNQINGKISLSSKEKNGLIIKELTADMTFTPEIMEFKSLNLLTNRSHLKDYYSMRYTSFNKDMNKFISNVMLEGHFKDSEVHSDDIAIFAPELKDWKKVIHLNGDAKGTIENLYLNNMNIKTGNSLITGNLSMKGLPDIDSTVIEYTTTQLKVHLDDLLSIAPDLKNIDINIIRKIGTIGFNGNFIGYYNNFKTKGLISSKMGNLRADVKMSFPENKLPSYEGYINTSSFNLSELTEENKLGHISLAGKIKGKGFSAKDLDVDFKGDIAGIEYNNYNFQNINVNGKFIKNKFNGLLSMNDPNCRIDRMEGSFHISKTDPYFNLNADVGFINLKKIQLLNRDLTLRGLFNLNFTGNDIDNFIGTARIYNAELKKENTRLSFDSLNISSTILNDKKTISLESNEIDAKLIGDFKLMDLKDAFSVFLNKYYPSFIKKPVLTNSEQTFSFNIQTRQIDPYIKLLDKNLGGFDNTKLSGNLNLENYELNLSARIPQFEYNQKSFSDIILNGRGNRDTLSTTIYLGEIMLSDSMKFPTGKLMMTSHNDISDVKLTTSATSTLNEADLNASIQTFTDGVRVNFYPSSFIINEKKWLLNKDGELTIRNKLINAKEVLFFHKNEFISIVTDTDEKSGLPFIKATINEIKLSDFVPYLFKDPAVNGELTGLIVVTDPLNRTNIHFKGFVDSLNIENKEIGHLKLDADADLKTGLISFNGDINDEKNKIKIEGVHNYKDSSDNQTDINIEAGQINLSVLEPYLDDVFSKIQGTGSAKLKIKGNYKNNYLTGNALIKKGKLEVGFTRCTYNINNQPIAFSNDLIEFDKIRLSDSLNNNATLNGRIRHQFFDNFSFEDIRVESEKLTLLNTTKKDNPVFWGNIIGRATMNLNGPLNNILINIDGEPNNIDSSHIYLSTSEEQESNTIDYIDFVKFGTEIEETKISNSTNIVLNLNIKANPACNVDVILDEETGDIVKGQGEGLINIRVGNNEPLSMRGAYQITKGEYTFNFQTFFKKPFTLNKGLINWNGDPYQANIDIEAEYLAKNVDISSLTTDAGFKQREDIKIISRLTGILLKPNVKFTFELPEKSDARRNDVIVKKLADFKTDDNEMNKQVASLLLFNSFITGNQNFLSQGNAGTLITGTIGGMISNLLTNFLNKELEKATNGILSTYIDINPTLDLQRSASQLQANVRAGLKILLNNRLVVLVGGNLDYNNSQYLQQLDRRGLITPDINVEWLINKEGSMRVVGFNRSSIDFALNQRNRSGLQLSYRKDMNKISDIFKSRKEIEAEEKRNKK